MRKMIVAITGASGIIYRYNLLKALNKIDEVERKEK
jgi:3-polyprenyl-4-hydroxybenzoate decarboxylase